MADTKTVGEVKSFLRLASFYCQFIINFGGIAVPMTECTKKGKFAWGKGQDTSIVLHG